MEFTKKYFTLFLMTLQQLKHSFLSLTEAERLELILQIRSSRTSFKPNSQTRQSRAKVSVEKKAKKKVDTGVAKLFEGKSLEEKMKLLKELQQ